MAEEYFLDEGYEESRRLIEIGILLEGKEPEEAERLYLESLRIYPSALGFYRIGKFCLRRGNNADARDYLRKAIELSVHGDTLFQLAKACVALGDHVAAERHLQELLQETPDHPAAKSLLFWIMVRRGEREIDVDRLSLQRSKVNEQICEALKEGEVSKAKALAQDAIESSLEPRGKCT